MADQLHEDLGDCLRLIHSAGEWNDDHEAMLARWREDRGPGAMTPWHWSAKLKGDELYGPEYLTRAEAIEWARKEYGLDEAIEVIEARTWNDDIRGDDTMWFAESRNHEVLGTEVPY